jgi:hypothetical protein
MFEVCQILSGSVQRGFNLLPAHFFLKIGVKNK